MALIKGTVSLSRYRVLDALPDLSGEVVSERLEGTAFVDIEATAEEESLGWVEILNPLSTEFPEHSFNFGEMFILGMRLDTRRVSTKVVNRYLAMAEAQAKKLSEKPLTGEQRRELKNKVRSDLLSRTPVSTDVYEVCWFFKREEIWLVGAGTKIRERFEDLWRRTFGLGLLLKIPFLMARELLPTGVTAEELENAQATALFGGRR